MYSMAVRMMARRMMAHGAHSTQLLPSACGAVVNGNNRTFSNSSSTNSTVVRCGVLGAGDIAGMHCEALHRIPNAELVGLWNRQNCPIVPDVEARAAELGAAVFPTAEALVSDDSVDAVLVLTNYETHLEYVHCK